VNQIRSVVHGHEEAGCDQRSPTARTHARIREQVRPSIARFIVSEPRRLACGSQPCSAALQGCAPAKAEGLQKSFQTTHSRTLITRSRCASASHSASTVPEGAVPSKAAGVVEAIGTTTSIGSPVNFTVLAIARSSVKDDPAR
jgi:hypothetical protein